MIDTWEGFMFINMDPHPAETLARESRRNRTGFSGYPFGELSADAIFLADGDQGQLESHQRCFPGGLAYTDTAP